MVDCGGLVPGENDHEEESTSCSNFPCLGLSMLSRKRVALALCWIQCGNGDGLWRGEVGSLSGLNGQSLLDRTCRRSLLGRRMVYTSLLGYRI